MPEEGMLLVRELNGFIVLPAWFRWYIPVESSCDRAVSPGF
jgi:hypothetical protein